MRLSDCETDRSKIYISLRGTTRGGACERQGESWTGVFFVGAAERGAVANLQGGAYPVVLTLSMPNGLFVSVSVVRFGLSLLAMMVEQVMTVRDLLGWGEDCLTVFSLVQNDLHPFLSKFRVCDLGPIPLLFEWHFRDSEEVSTYCPRSCLYSQGFLLSFHALADMF